MNAPLSDRLAHVLLENEPGWRRVEEGGITLWFKGYEQTRDRRALAAEAAGLAPRWDAMEAWLAGLDGFFALVAEGPGWVLAAADRVASIPLVHARDHGRVVLAQNGPALEKATSLGPDDVDPEGARAIALGGYTIGADTLYRDVRRLTPGRYLLADADQTREARYGHWRPSQPGAADPADLVEPLSTLHEQVIDKLVRSANGRPILVPLSAGLDSRMVLSGLVEAGYPDLHAFSYGLSGNREAQVAGRIAHELGVPWTFVPYGQRVQRAAMTGERHRAYERYADSLTGIHFPQDYLALAAMVDEGRVDPETIVVNGQSGDFITGNHILPPLTEPAPEASEEARAARVVDTAIRKHFKMWHALQTPAYLEPLRDRLRREIDAEGGMPADAHGDHGVYEQLEFANRQSKYVVHGQRAYEFFGLDWRLPLWDRDYMDFWQAAPLAAKRGQSLYRTVLERDNWGGVWRDMPVNPRRIRPGWLVPVRLALKAMHAPLGRDRWHRFERRFLDYWMAPLCSYAPWPYHRVALDRRGHANALAWYCEAYLNAKGLAWDGTPL